MANMSAGRNRPPGGPEMSPDVIRRRALATASRLRSRPTMSGAERALHFFARPLLRCFYRVTAHGLENLPEGGFLLLPNHITWVDAIVLQLACPRPIRYIIDQEFYRKPLLRPLLRTVGCIPIDSLKARSTIRAATEQIAPGEIVCL